MGKYRVVHYINQFFGQIGGEEKSITNRKPGGFVGPGMAFNAAFGDKAEIVGTVICGDSYSTRTLRATKEVLI